MNNANKDIIAKWLSAKGWENVAFDGAWVTGNKNGNALYMSFNDACDEWKSGK